MKSLRKVFGSSSPSKDNDAQPNTQSTSKQPLSQPKLDPGYYGHFPNSFSVYFSGSSDDKKTEYFFLGIANNTQITALNAFASHMRTGKHQITLFSGPKHTSSPIALAGIEKYLRSAYLIALPAPSTGSEETTNRIIRVERTGGGLGRDIYRFELDVGQDQHSEAFEWRSDSELRPQDDKQFERWLVRLASDATDGEDVVATWVEEGTPETEAKLGTFHFRGSATTGDLGSYWALGVVVSLLRINQARWVASAAADTVIEAAGKMAVGGISIGAVGAGI